MPARAKRPAPIWQVARCHRCQREREGVTTFEGLPQGHRPAGRAIHYCDECAAELAAGERPLEVVLSEMLEAFIP